MTMESIYEDFLKNTCKNCKRNQYCQEELTIKIDNSIECDKYERSDKS